MFVISWKGLRLKRKQKSKARRHACSRNLSYPIHRSFRFLHLFLTLATLACLTLDILFFLHSLISSRSILSWLAFSFLVDLCCLSNTILSYFVLSILSIYKPKAIAQCAWCGGGPLNLQDMIAVCKELFQTIHIHPQGVGWLTNLNPKRDTHQTCLTKTRIFVEVEVTS